MPQEPSYQLESLQYSAKLGLWVLVAAHDITTSNLPVAGTTTLTATGTNGLKLPTAGRPHSTYDNYKYTHLSPAATAGYFRLNFVDVFPTTPLVMENIDPIWGKVRTHTYVALTGSDIPDVSTASVAALGAPGNGRYVLRVSEQQLSGDVCIVTITTVAALTVSQTDKPVDPKTGDAFTRTKTWTLATSAPSAVALTTDGRSTSVTQESHNLWLSVDEPVNVRVGSSNKRTHIEYRAMVWPAVLLGYDTEELIEYQASGDERHITVARYSLCPAYAEPCLVTIDEWWQKAAPADTDFSDKSAPFQPSSVDIVGVGNPTSIPPCLHGSISYESQVYDYGELGFSVFEVTISATPNHTTWPDTFVEYVVEPDMGGYTIKKLTWTKPFAPTASITSSVTPA